MPKSNLGKFIKDSLNKIDKGHNRRKLLKVSSEVSKFIVIEGKIFLNLSSNNYLGLANDPRLKEAAIRATGKYGTSSASSRLISGSLEIHEKLESELASYFLSESCLLYNSGYQANLGIIPALMGKDDEIICDRLSHASIIDGILLSGARFRRFPHLDYSALENALKKIPLKTKKMIITESIFSMDGDIANIPVLIQLAEKYNAILYIDEAHSFGVIGQKGKGVLEKFNVKPNNNIIRLGTLGKAFGSFGGFVLGSKNLREFLINKSRSFIFSTALPPSVSASSIAALKIIKSEPKRRQKLWDSSKYLCHKLKIIGFDTMKSQSHIIPILIGDNKITMEFSRKLFEKNIFTPGIRPPTVPPNQSRLRISVTSSLSKNELDMIIYSLECIKEKLL